MPRTAIHLTVDHNDAATLRRWARSTSVRAGLGLRARIVLLAAEGVSNTDIGARVGCSRQAVVRWRARYARQGLAGLGDQPRSGRPRIIDDQRRTEIVAVTLAGPPAELGITHWSTRTLANHLKVSRMTVARVWADHELAPHRLETFKFSTDPELLAKVTDICGLYLEPPAGAVVLCVDEKSQIQALDRTAPTLPLRPGLAERRTHDDVRHGITSLFAALDIATGKVTGRCFDRHRHSEFLAFLKLVARRYPRRELHVVLGNCGTHKHPAVRRWLDTHPRIQLHFTPTSASWMNQVETFFGLLTRQAIRRGSHRSVPDLVAAIHRYLDAWNDHCQPFAWVKDADNIMIKATRNRTSGTQH
jgi:DDE superfamily endonuclease/Homeodomain-like domain